MTAAENVCTLRVRYSETDQMGTYYNSRPLEWFECGRTELLRALGIPYTSMEQQGVLLPLVESHVVYQGRARYDDELKIATRAELCGKARVRFDVTITQAATGAPVVNGYTVHAIIGANGRPMRPPEWLSEKIDPAPTAPLPAQRSGLSTRE